MKHVKTLPGYTAQARFLAECDRDPADPELAREVGEHILPNGVTKVVFLWKGKRVILLGGSGRSVNVSEVTEQ